MTLIEKHIDQIRQLCLTHNVDKLFVFGSILTDNFNPKSDVDLIVDFKGVAIPEYADNYFGLKSALEKIFKREVDLLEDKAIRNPYLRKSIDSSKKLVYGE